MSPSLPLAKMGAGAQILELHSVVTTDAPAPTRWTERIGTSRAITHLGPRATAVAMGSINLAAAERNGARSRTELQPFLDYADETAVQKLGSLIARAQS